MTSRSAGRSSSAIAARAYWRLFRRRWRAFKLTALGAFIRYLPSESQRVFALTLVAGALCGLAAVAFHLAITWFETRLMGAALESPNMVVLGILTPAAGGIVCGLLLAYVAPGARGSGIPQVKIAYAIKGGQMPLREAIAKFGISALQIGSGSGRLDAKVRRSTFAPVLRAARTGVRPVAKEFETAAAGRCRGRHCGCL